MTAKESEKKKIIIAILEYLSQVPLRQLEAMYQVMTMAAEAAFQLNQAAALGQPLALKMEIVDVRELPGSPQGEFKS